MNIGMERYMLSATAKKRRRIVTGMEYVICGLLGIGVYVLTGFALRWLGVA